LGGRHIVADLAAPDQVTSLARQLSENGVPDIVVFGAGVGMSAPADSAADDDIEGLMAVNLLAPMRLTRLLLPGMISRRGGHLVYVSSIAGALGVPTESAYAASKGGLTLYTDSVRAEVAGSGIGVTNVLPG